MSCSHGESTRATSAHMLFSVLIVLLVYPSGLIADPCDPIGLVSYSDFFVGTSTNIGGVRSGTIEEIRDSHLLIDANWVAAVA